jgi:hypothetical protein
MIRAGHTAEAALKSAQPSSGEYWVVLGASRIAHSSCAQGPGGRLTSVCAFRGRPQGPAARSSGVTAMGEELVSLFCPAGFTPILGLCAPESVRSGAGLSTGLKRLR